MPYILTLILTQGNFHHWRPLLLHFDTYFKTYLLCRNDLTLSDNLEDDIPLPKHAILQILRVMQIIFENCPNKSTFDGLEVNCKDIMIPFNCSLTLIYLFISFYLLF